MERLSKNDRDSFAYAMGLYTMDFVKLVNGLNQLENQLKLKDKEIDDLNYVIKDLEHNIQSMSPGETDEDIIQDIETAIKVIKKLCAKNPEVLEKIRQSVEFKTITI